MFAVSAFIIFSAQILDSLVVKVELPFTDIKGLIEDGSYKISFPNHTDLRSSRYVS